MICRQADNKSDLEVFWFLQICSKGYCHQIWIHMLLNSGEQKYFSPPKTFPRLAECLTSWESDSEICLQDLKDLSLQ